MILQTKLGEKAFCESLIGKAVVYLHDRELLGLLLRGVAGNLGYNHENSSIHLNRQINTNVKMFLL